MLERFFKIRSEILSGGDLSRADAEWLAEAPDVFVPYMAALGNEVREHFVGKKFEACALCNIQSGRCSEDCRFCAQSGHYTTPGPEYGLISEEEILNQAKAAESLGATEFCLVSSGRGFPDGDRFDRIVRTLSRIGRETSMRADCSLGFLTDEQMRKLKTVGVFRNNHNLETSERHFASVCTTHRWSDRLEHVKRLGQEGIEPCSGGIFGVGESHADRLDLAYALKSAGAQCVPINILNPRPGTPLEHSQVPSPMEVIRFVAIYRLIFPKATIKIAGGRETSLRELQASAMQAGANGLVLGNYLTTSGRNAATDLQMMRDLGFEVKAPLSSV